MSDVIHMSFDKAENDISCLLIMRKNSNGSMALLKEFYGEEAEALYNFLTKPVVLPFKEENMFHENNTPTKKDFSQLLGEKLRVVKDLYPDKKKKAIMIDRLLNCNNEAQLENTMVWGTS